MSGKKKAVAYVVANPRGIPSGKHILQSKDRSQRWYEGDAWTGPDGDVAWLVRQGFLVEVTDGNMEILP